MEDVPRPVIIPSKSKLTLICNTVQGPGAGAFPIRNGCFTRSRYDMADISVRIQNQLHRASIKSYRGPTEYADQVSVFLAGRVNDYIGGFVRGTFSRSDMIAIPTSRSMAAISFSVTARTS